MNAYLKLRITLMLILTCIFFTYGYTYGSETKNNPPNLSSFVVDFYYSKENGLIYYSDGKEVIIYNIVNRETEARYNVSINSIITSIVASNDKEWLFMGTDDGRIFSYILNDFRQFQEYDASSGRITAMTLSSDNQNLICGTSSGKVLKFNATNVDENEITFSHKQAVTAIISLDDMQLLASSSGDGTISIFCEQTYKLKTVIETSHTWVRDISYNEEKKRLYSVGDNGHLTEWNIANPENIRSLRNIKVSRSWLTTVDTNIDGSSIAASGINHRFKVIVPFGIYNSRLRGPVLKIRIVEVGANSYIIACVYGRGIQTIEYKEMKFRFNR